MFNEFNIPFNDQTELQVIRDEYVRNFNIQKQIFWAISNCKIIGLFRWIIKLNVYICNAFYREKEKSFLGQLGLNRYEHT